jgi:glycosyltransferase involved in cell wall biosynthesis
MVQMDLNLDDLNTQPDDKKQVFAYIMKHQELGHIRVVFKPLNNDFASFKNHLTDQCTGDYIFQIDADELPNETLISLLPDILNTNPDVDVMLVPRWNTVHGLTKEFVDKYKWSVDQYERVNWPDYQWRIYKNSQSIRWINKVHERLDGFTSYATLPQDESVALYHPKTIERQQKQNEYYDKF